MKNSFVMYTDYQEQIDLLSREQRGDLFTAILSYASDGSLPEMDGMTKMAFAFIKSQMDRDHEKYQKTVEKRREAGKLGGRPKAEGILEKQTKAKKANGFSEKQTKAKKPDNEDVYEDDNDNVNDKDNKTSCPEPEESAPDSPVAASFMLNDGSLYDVTENDVVRYQQLYPGIDVMTELRKMVGWCDANPANRKTRKGAKRFLNGWLSRAQDKAPVEKKKVSGVTNRFNNFHQRDYDFDDLERQLLSAGGKDAR